MLNPVEVLLEPAHSKFGGSVATRVLRCPASVGLVEKVPTHLRKTSSYAARDAAPLLLKKTSLEHVK
jgi:hypothetical protein